MERMFNVLLIVLGLTFLREISGAERKSTHQYCVIGAGPGGLQMAQLLQQAGRDYIVYEKASSAGTFYAKYPIHRSIISINKRNTGKTNKEFNFRHDWNSLISNDESLQMTKYSKDFFPSADVLVQYLNDFVAKLKLNVQFNTTIGNIKKRDSVNKLFHVTDQNGMKYTCKTIIVATGIAKPNRIHFQGSEYSTGYEDLTLDKEHYEGKSVLILGLGNSAFETAKHIRSVTNVLHLWSRSRVRLAWSTHYVGDLRAINNGLLDTYQLKSLDGILEGDITDLDFRRNEQDGRLYPDEDFEKENYKMTVNDDGSSRDGYDHIISCLGFKFDDSIFNETIKFRNNKYPAITHRYESINVPGVFFAGANTHSLDWKKSAGGFIHGFRYSARTLHRMLETRYHNVEWPSVSFESPIDVIPHILKRFNEASDIYQMFGVLCEVMIFSQDSKRVTYLEAYPCALITQIPNVSGHSVPGKIVVGVMEYGKNASGPAKDVFGPDRAVGGGLEAHRSRFLHPVLYYYNTPPQDKEMIGLPDKWILPVPDRIHHLVEDFTTVFDSARAHQLLIRRFLEYVVGFDLRNFYADHCMAVTMTSDILPESCRLHDLRGKGVTSSEKLEKAAKHMPRWFLHRMS